LTEMLELHLGMKGDAARTRVIELSPWLVFLGLKNDWKTIPINSAAVCGRE